MKDTDVLNLLGLSEYSSLIKIKPVKIYKSYELLNVSIQPPNRWKSDDEIYQQNKKLQEKLPRGYFLLFKNNKLILSTHGTHKFSGMEDDISDKTIFMPGFNNFKEADHAIFSEKSNGKLVTVKFFRDDSDHPIWVILTSKTTGIIMPLDDLEKYNDASGLMNDILIAFKEMWKELPDKTTTILIEKCINNHTIQFEFNDGRHIVPLENEKPKLEFTQLIHVNQDPTYSYPLTVVDKNLFYDWLEKIEVPDKYRIRQMSIKWGDFQDTMDRALYHNLFNLGTNIEGYVVTVLTKDNHPIALYKVKNISYVLLRMLRERCKQQNVDYDSICCMLERRCTGSKAYPKLMHDDYRLNIEYIFCHFLSWVKKQDQPITWILGFMDDSPGMGVTWDKFCQQYNLSLEDCYTSCERFCDKIPTYKLPPLIIKKPMKGVINVKDKQSIPEINKKINVLTGQTGKKKKSEDHISVYGGKNNIVSINGHESKWDTIDDLFQTLEEFRTEEIEKPLPKSRDDSAWVSELRQFAKQYISNKIQDGVHVLKNAKRVFTVTRYGDGQMVTILRGVSGVGKTTFAEMLGYDICSADDFPSLYDGGVFQPMMLSHAHNWCREMMIKSLIQKRPCVISNTCIELWEISAYAVACLDIGITIIQIEPFENTPIRNIHEVPKDKVQQKLDALRKNPLPDSLMGIAKAPIPSYIIKGKPLITVVSFPATPFLQYTDQEEVKNEFHCTVYFGKDIRNTLPDTLTFKGFRLLERQEGVSVIRCIEGVLFDGDKEIQVDSGVTHVTTYVAGDFSAKDAKTLIQTPEKDDVQTECNITIMGVVTLLL